MPTPNAVPSFKEQAHALIDQLPDTASWEDVIEKARFRKAVEDGVAAADRGEFASDEEVRTAFAEWGVKV